MRSDRVVLAVGAGSYGGAEHYLEMLAEQMRRCGADVHVVGTFETARELDGVSYTPVPLGPKWSKRHLLRSAVSALPERRRLLRALRATQPTVVHAQFKREQILLSRAMAHRTRVVWTEHGVFPDGPYGWVLGLLYRRAARSVQRIICVSEQVRSSLVERVGIPADKTVVIENAVDLARFHPDADGRTRARRHFGFEVGDFVAVTLSRLEWDKGIDRAIDAMTALPAHHRLLVAGAGGYEDDLRQRAESLGTRVTFTGFLTDVRPALLAADVFLLPSRAR